MKKFAGIFMLALMASCNSSTEKKAAPQEIAGAEQTTDTVILRNDTVVNTRSTIQPGKSIGNIFLEEDAALLEQKLGLPDSSDAAMGKAWLTWFGKKRDEHNNRTELNIYTAYKDTSMNGKSVKQVRTTSSSFKTPDGIQVYAGFETVRKNYSIKEVGSYTGKDERDVLVCDDAGKGIAFEFAGAGNEKICMGIIIHQPGKPLLDTYISYHPDMKIIK